MTQVRPYSTAQRWTARQRADRAINEIMRPAEPTVAEDRVTLAGLQEGKRILYSALTYIFKGSYVDLPQGKQLAIDQIRSTLQDVYHHIEAITRRLPKPPSLWKRIKTWSASLSTRHGDPAFADGGFVVSESVADWFRAQPKPEPPPVCRAWKFSTREEAVENARFILMSRAITSDGEIVGFLPLVPKPPLGFGGVSTYYAGKILERRHHLLRQSAALGRLAARELEHRRFSAKAAAPLQDAPRKIRWSVSQDAKFWRGAIALENGPDDPDQPDIWRTAILADGSFYGVKFWREL